MPGFVLWFTGLSGSGKSTLTAMVSAELRRRGVHVETLDGDEVRKHLSKGLGFSREDRDANIRRIGFVARLVARSGACAIAAAISPYREIRNEIRRSTDRFCEVYTECPIDVLADRDPKGLYKKALAGEIKNFTGVDDPYQAPEDPEVHLRTDKEPADVSLGKIIAKLEELGFIPAQDHSGSIAADVNGGLVPPHGHDLVDRMLRGDLLADARDRAPNLPSVTLDATAAAHLGFVGCGAYSPLKGFIGSKDYARIVDAARLESGIPWAMPLTLSIGSEDAERLRGVGEVALRGESGDLLGLLSVSDIFQPDRRREVTARFGDSPVERMASSAISSLPPWCLGGEIRCARLSPLGGSVVPSTPRDIRLQMTRRGWRRVIALDWRDAVVTTAHEYLARASLELADGLVILVSSGPSDAVPIALRLECLRDLFKNYFPENCALLVPYPEPALAGKRAALHAAVLAQNAGASLLVHPLDSQSMVRSSATLAEHQTELAIQLWPAGDVGMVEAVGGLASRFTAPSAINTKLPDGLDLLSSLRKGDTPWLRPEVAARLRQQK